MQTMRVLTGGRDDKEQHQQHHGHHPSGELSSEVIGNGNGDSTDAVNNNSCGIFPESGGSGGRGHAGRGGGGGGGRKGLFAPVPQRPSRSPSPPLHGGSLENSPAAAGGESPMRRHGRSPSPIASLMRRASFPANARPWNFLDLRGGGHGPSRYGTARHGVSCLCLSVVLIDSLGSVYWGGVLLSSFCSYVGIREP